MIRLDTIEASDNQAEWSPASSPVRLQLAAQRSSVKVDVMTKIHADAPYVKVAALYHDDPVISLADLPFIKLEMTGNMAGEQVRVWDGE